MTITATPDPTFAPPRVAVQVNAPATSVMATVAVFRTSPGEPRALLLSQPAAGLDQRLVYDYYPPYGVPITYDWETTYVDSTSIVQLWTEAWASTAAWTLVGASWSVSGGKLVWTGADSPAATCTRTLTPGLYRILLAAVPVGVQYINLGTGFYIDVKASKLIAGSDSITFAPGTTTWVIDMTATSVTITTSAGTYSVAASVTASMVQFSGAVSTLTPGTSWALPVGAGTGQFPNGSAVGLIATDESGNMFLADPFTKRVHVFTNAGVYVTTFGATGTGNGQFSEIRALATDGTNVFVADAKRIQKFVPSGGTYVYSAQVGSAGTGNGQFGSWGVGRLAVDSATGKVYATDPDNHRVQRFSNALAYEAQVGSLGTTDGKFSYPGEIAVFGAKVAVSDSSGRVQILTTAFVYERTLPQGYTAGSLYNVAAMVGDTAGTLYVISDATVPVNGSPSRLSKFSTTGEYLGGLDNVAIGFIADGNGYGHYPHGLAFRNSTREVFLYDGQAKRVKPFTQPRASIDDVTLYSYAVSGFLAESVTVTLEVGEGWMIHPASPALSMALSYEDLDAVTIETIGAVTQETTRTLHAVMGNAKPISVSAGPRMSDRFTLQLAIEEASDEVALRALLADQLPLLFRVPPSWELGFIDGFYDVGTTTIERVLQLYGQPARVITMPLTLVEAPDVTQANVGWSWASLAAEFPTWAAVAAAFATWADVQSNTRRPGF